MSMRIVTVAATSLAAVAVFSVPAARAQTIYFGGQAGWTMLEDQTSRTRGAPTINSSFESGFMAGARIGYEWAPWRFEGEYAYRRNELDSMTVGGVGIAGVKGNRQSHALMANLLYDFNLGWPVTPHIGAGVGAVNLIDTAAAPVFFDDSTWQFGYQAIAGFRYNMSPNIAFDLDYRYFATTEATFRVPGTTATYKTGYDTHNVIASVVYRFVPPPPPPAPAPVAMPPAPLPPPPPPVARGERG